MLSLPNPERFREGGCDMNFKKTYHLHPAMKLLHAAIRKERNIKLVFALCLMTGGVVVPYIYFQFNSYAVIAGLIALIIGSKLLLDIIRTPRTVDERLWFLLKEQPEKIVWVYSVTTRCMPFGFHLWDTGNMYFKLLDGGEISISLPAKKMKMVSRFLNRLLPHASFGYSRERQMQFEKDPALLVKNAW